MENLQNLFIDFPVFYFALLNCIFKLNGTVNPNLKNYGDILLSLLAFCILSQGS